jgi:hypothetical protein
MERAVVHPIGKFQKKQDNPRNQYPAQHGVEEIIKGDILSMYNKINPN